MKNAPDETYANSVVFVGDVHDTLKRANTWMIDNKQTIKSMYYAFNRLTLYIK